mmetsp:Transcript_15010/g.32519  ORF Transcript_15010/g.32519 Transcript_15010/m.32519 type:complete len:110 (+) Transcript_15010:2-331(+)
MALQLIPVLFFIIPIIAILAPHLGALFVPVVAYMAISVAVCWRAAAWTATHAGGWAVLAVPGAVAFLISDGFIGVNKFVGPFPGRDVVVMTTYWLGQVLMTSSIVNSAV